MWWVARTVDFDQYICIFLSDTISCYVSVGSDHLQFRNPKYPKVLRGQERARRQGEPREVRLRRFREVP